MADFTIGDSSRSTWHYGVITIAINWLPGVVAAIHIMAMYRHHYPTINILVAAGNLMALFPD